ncbi:hypothetical protein [Mammaliicoccus sciuri]|uniref:hypothetical protein n=1 Tax=Mammaliicoccus sciuri TaxID=1296 RepID=UPI0018EDA86E|nr:hypothetical protein [Mammaliicoccus sciuri]
MKMESKKGFFFLYIYVTLYIISGGLTGVFYENSNIEFSNVMLPIAVYIFFVLLITHTLSGFEEKRLIDLNNVALLSYGISYILYGFIEQKYIDGFIDQKYIIVEVFLKFFVFLLLLIIFISIFMGIFLKISNKDWLQNNNENLNENDNKFKETKIIKEVKEVKGDKGVKELREVKEVKELKELKELKEIE